MGKSIDKYVEVAAALAKVPGVTEVRVEKAKGGRYCIHYMWGPGLPNWITLASAKAIVKRGHV